MKSGKPIGWLLITGAVGILIPYSILTITFQYPDILREDTGQILRKFHEGGNRLIFTWLFFALIGFPLIPAYSMIGQKFEKHSSLIRFATSIGITGLILQMIGLLRWTFVVPVLAKSFVTATDTATSTAAIHSFNVIHQFGGVLIGEHLGQLFTIIWSIILSISFIRLKVFPQWIHILGIISALIYLTAQTELLSTIMPGMPVWEMGGFIGSTLWLIWLIILGVHFIKETKGPGPKG